MEKAPETIAKELIESIPYITIASVSASGEPWNSPVFSAHDENYVMYWGSDQGSQHSQNIRQTGKVFLVIYNSMIEPGKGMGVYIQAQAAELEAYDERAAACSVLNERFGTPYLTPDAVQGDTPVRLYKAVPQRVWVSANKKVNGVTVNGRQEVTIP